MTEQYQDQQTPAPSTLPQEHLEAIRKWKEVAFARSKRTPESSWRYNIADRTDRQMQQDDHQLWGFVIYRTTYNNDTEWAEALSRLRHDYEEAFHMDNGDDILGQLRLTVMDDKQKFNGATADDIRHHFQTWALESYKHEQSQERDERQQLAGLNRSPRYNFAVQIDGDSLHSIIHDTPETPDWDIDHKGWVKVIKRSWSLESEEELDDHETQYEPLEGFTVWDVGWVRIPVVSVMTEWYVQSYELNNWPTYYRRPPQVVYCG